MKALVALKRVVTEKRAFCVRLNGGPYRIKVALLPQYVRERGN
jgi:hypothetical protein